MSFCQVLKKVHTKENWFLFSSSDWQQAGGSCLPLYMASIINISHFTDSKLTYATSCYKWQIYFQILTFCLNSSLCRTIKQQRCAKMTANRSAVKHHFSSTITRPSFATFASSYIVFVFDDHLQEMTIHWNGAHCQYEIVKLYRQHVFKTWYRRIPRRWTSF